MTVEVVLFAQVESETGDDGREVDETAVVAVSISLTDKPLEVEVEVDLLAETELVAETGTSGILIVAERALEAVTVTGNEDTHRGVRDDVPETGLLVAGEQVGDIHHIVSVKIVERNVLAGSTVPSTVRLVVQTVPAETKTGNRGDPLADIDFGSEAEVALETAVINSVDTSAKIEEPVVPQAVGLISTADDVTIGVAIGILLRGSVEGDSQERCSSKNSENSFDTFHIENLVKIIICLSNMPSTKHNQSQR